MSGWYYEKHSLTGTTEVGPLADVAVLKLARDGIIGENTMVRHEVHTENQWVPLSIIPAAKAKIDEGSAERQVARIEKARSVSIATLSATKNGAVIVVKAIGGALSTFVRKREPIIEPHNREIIDSETTSAYRIVEREPSPTHIPCKFCHEQIIATALKCKHCGEFTDPRFAPQQPSAPTIIINNSNDNYVSQQHSQAIAMSSSSGIEDSGMGCLGAIRTIIVIGLLGTVAIAIIGAMMGK